MHEADVRGSKCFSWSAIILGALVAVGISVLLNLFSVALGLSALDSTQEGATVIAFGGLAALAVGTIAAMFLAGWIAGYLGGYCWAKPYWGLLYGFTTWCLALLLMALLAIPLGRYVNLYTGFVSNPSVTAMVPARPALAIHPTARDEQPLARDNSDAAENTRKAFTVTAFAVFILFLVGAISAALGGHFGMSHRCGHKDDDDLNHARDRERDRDVNNLRR